MAYSKEYDDLAKRIANEVFYPENPELALIFYRMIKQECAFDLDVIEGRRVSSAGAVGIAQFMPATAKERGVDPLNPEEALRGAAAYLKDLIAYHGGDIEKGVASYNCGPGTVDTACKQGTGDWKSLLPAETQTYLQVVGLLGGMAGQAAGMAGEAGVGGFAPAGGQALAGQGAAASDVIPWLSQFFKDIPGDPPYTAYEQASDLFYEDPFKAIDLWRRETGQEAGLTPLEREATEADIEYTRALARQVIAKLGGDTYDQKRQEFLDKIDQENWTGKQAISEFNAWMSGALEAGKRAETVYGEEMKRKVWTTPEEYYPGTEPGGPRQQWTEKYGVPYTPSPGIAVETLPNLEQMYGQWHQNMGISQQAPPTQGGWSGQDMGQGAPAGGMQGGAPMGGQGKGYDAAMAFLDQLRQRYAPQFGAGRA